MKFFSKVKSFSKSVGSGFYDFFVEFGKADNRFEKPEFRFSGKISEITIHEDKYRGVVSTTAEAYMQIFHKGNGVLILINPKYFEQSKVEYFSSTKEGCFGGYGKLYPSLYSINPVLSKEITKLKETLESNKAPEDLVITLKSDENTGWEEMI